MKRISEKYDRNKISQVLNKLEISQSGYTVSTKFDGDLIAQSKVTDVYDLFNFTSFAENIIKEIENYFIPKEYILRISKGQQELRLIGEEISVNGEKYSKMFNILNSTDKSRALQLNVGLIRFICTNGMVIAIDDEYSGIKTKHFKSTLPEKVNMFNEKLGNFNIIIDKQVETIENLKGRFVSFDELMKKIALDDKGFYKESMDLKLKSFGSKLIESQTDRILNLQSEQIALLKNPSLFLNPNYKGINVEMTAYQALNCWTEVYRSYDSSILKRETNRILEII